MQKSHLRSWVGCRNPALRWDQIFIPGGKGGIPLPKVGSCHSHLGSWAGLLGSHLYPAWHFTWVLGAELNVVQSAMDLGSYCMLWPEMDRPHIFSSCKSQLHDGFYQTLVHKRPQKRPCEDPTSITGKITSLLCNSTVSSSISHTNVQDQKHPAQSHTIHMQISWPLLQGTSIRTELTSPELLAGISRHCQFF